MYLVIDKITVMDVLNFKFELNDIGTKNDSERKRFLSSDSIFKEYLLLII